MIRPIDRVLLDDVSREARNAARGRKNRNFHIHDAQPAHRLLNAIEPGSYIMPHRHLDPAKDETVVVLRGRLGLVVFDDAGTIAQTLLLGPDLDAQGVDIAHGTWHTVLALATDTVFLEAKAGPYVPLSVAEKAPWAPEEGSVDAPAYLSQLRSRFD